MVFLFTKYHNVNKYKWRNLESAFTHGAEVRWLCTLRLSLKSILEKLKGHNYFSTADNNMIITLSF